MCDLCSLLCVRVGPLCTCDELPYVRLIRSLLCVLGLFYKAVLTRTPDFAIDELRVHEAQVVWAEMCVCV